MFNQKDIGQKVQIFIAQWKYFTQLCVPPDKYARLSNIHTFSEISCSG